MAYTIEIEVEDETAQDVLDWVTQRSNELPAGPVVTVLEQMKDQLEECIDENS